MEQATAARSGILTVTVNPALDVALSVDELVPDHKLKARTHRRDPGGGGVNVSRALRRLGVESDAWVAVGGAIGDEFVTLLRAEGITPIAYPIPGMTREAFAVRDDASGCEFRVVVDGPTVCDPEAMAADIVARAAGAHTVVLSGYLAPGLPDAFYACVLAQLPADVTTVVDCDAGPLEHVVADGASLIKPSLRELSTLVHSAPITGGEVEAAALEVLRRGSVGAVVVSLGERGAALVPREGPTAWFTAPPVADVASTVGTGDAMVAAIVASLSTGAALRDACRRGVAAGTAAVQLPGTQFATSAEIDAVVELVEVR